MLVRIRQLHRYIELLDQRLDCRKVKGTGDDQNPIRPRIRNQLNIPGKPAFASANGDPARSSCPRQTWNIRLGRLPSRCLRTPTP